MSGERRRPSILIIDDDLNLLHMLEIGLQRDYDVVSAFDSEKAIEIFSQGDFDVVITDVMMPRVSGFEILKTVKETGWKASTPWNTDYLTGLSSRSHFSSQLNLEFELSKRHGRSLSCLVFDVDGFKKINDELSHRCGDLVLQGLGALLTSNSRVTDLKCRYGGDEFVLILPETDEVGSMRFAEKLRCLVEKEWFDLVERPFSITISLGIATYWGRNFHSADELIHAADMALILAKREGRNCIRFFRTIPSLVPSVVSSAALSPDQ